MASFVLPTCERPALLRRSLGSVLQALRADSGITVVRVVDDSRSVEGQQETRRVVEHLGANAEVPVVYLGPDERSRLAERIRQRVPGAVPADVLRHALLGWAEAPVGRGGGGARNSAVLAGAGEPVLSLDDDARFEFVALTDTLNNQDKSFETVEVREAGERFQQGTVDSLRRINRLTEPVEQDLVARMLEALGGSGNDGTGRPVRAVMTGIAGNRWYQRLDPNFHSRGGPRELMLRSRRRFRRGLAAGYSLMQSRSPMLTDSPFLVTCCHAVQTQVLVPPFPPDVRSEDTLFARLLRRYEPESLIAHLPVMVCHDLGPRRPDPWRDPHAQTPTRDTITTGMLTDTLNRAIPQPGRAGLRALGVRLQEVAALPPADWRAWAHAIWAQTLGAAAFSQKQSLARFNERPDFWATDVRRSHDRIASASPALSAPFLGELEAVRGYLHGMGDLLRWWPEIWDAALALQQEQSG